MPKCRKKRWSKMIEESGLAVRLFERAGSSAVWYSVIENGEKIRRTLKTRDRTVAEDRAREIAKELATARLIGLRSNALMLNQLFAAYRRHRLPTLRPYRQRYAETYIAMFVEAWGPDLPVLDVDQTRVDTYVAKRRSLEVTPLAFELDEAGRIRRGGRRPTPPRDGTLDRGDFAWLSAVFNWGRRHRINSKRLLTENPLHGLTWPRERQPRRPVARHERFVATMKHVEKVDAKGRLRCILALARYTGRRESAICNLRADDLLLSERRVLAALAEAGMDEAIAEHMPHGAIRWRSEADKMGLLFISPISKPAKEALEAYLSDNPRVGDVSLFPAPGPIRKKGKGEKPAEPKPKKPISRHLATKWLLRAEALAGLPKLERGTFHPYRRLWATERKSYPDVDVAYAAGWKDTRAMKVSYQRADAATVLRVVEGA